MKTIVTTAQQKNIIGGNTPGTYVIPGGGYGVTPTNPGFYQQPGAQGINKKSSGNGKK